jgi:hypothetical protein
MYGMTICQLSPIQLKASKRTANAIKGAAIRDAASSRKRCRFLILWGSIVLSSVTCSFSDFQLVDGSGADEVHEIPAAKGTKPYKSVPVA